MTSLRVEEIFCSIQGESTFAGRPCAFVRLTGCPLRCVWCDTTYAYSGGDLRTIGDVVDRLAAFDVDLVEVTGGEPLAQAGTLDLLRVLCDRGFEVLLETSGALDISSVDPRVRRIVDVKCPSSGMADRNRWDNFEHLRKADEIKLVLADRADYEFAREIIREHRLIERCPVLLSPVTGLIEPKEVVEWMLADHLDARFQLQLHKLIWPTDTRGV